MSTLGFLFSRRTAVGAGGTPVVFPVGARIVTYSPEPVLYTEEESNRIEGGPPAKVRRLFDRWISGNSTAVQRYKYQPYADTNGTYGSIWVQFTSSRKQYNYPNVPWIEFVSMIRAASRGTFVNNVLRRLYSVGIGSLRPSKPHATPHLGRKPRKLSWK